MSNAGASSLLGGQLPIKVVKDNHYIPPLITGAEDDMETTFPSLGHVLDSSQVKTVVLVGTAGSGKTTALEKLTVDWAKGEHGQKFSHVFLFDLKDLSRLDGLYSLKTLMLQNRHSFEPESVALVLQKPESVLFVFDTLDLYQHPLDRSVHTLCSDPSTATAISTLVASLLHGTLLSGATFLVATRPTAGLKFLEGFKLMQEMLLAVSFLLDKTIAKDATELLSAHEGHAEYLHLFLSGLLNSDQRRPLESLLGVFDNEQLMDFERWLKTSTQKAIAGYHKEKHLRCFRLLRENQNEALVREIITSPARLGISYGGLGLLDCVALNYVVESLGELEQLNLYSANNLTEEGTEILIPAMRLAQKIILTEACCGDLSSALTSASSQLRVLDLTFNKLGDQGLTQLCEALQSPSCKLQELQLNDTNLTGKCCPGFAKALRSDHCSLVELDLSLNELGPEGALQLCKALREPGCPLENLCLTRCELTAVVFTEFGLLVQSGSSQLKCLSLALNDVGDDAMKTLWKAIADPCCLLEDLRQLTDASSGDLCAALKATRSLRRLDLSNNSLSDASVPALVQVVQDSPCLQEVNLKYNDLSEDV
ncbi:hypothetical protein CRUP_000296 [Coryphaenoides rupestris]|nr:hypothetical protein CRUP_000296 [Coryphaenoides rupestris]